jgi:hypothetical protein
MLEFAAGQVRRRGRRGLTALDRLKPLQGVIGQRKRRYEGRNGFRQGDSLEMNASIYRLLRSSFA